MTKIAIYKTFGKQLYSGDTHVFVIIFFFLPKVVCMISDDIVETLRTPGSSELWGFKRINVYNYN